MFSATCRQLVNSLGMDTLIPVPSLDEQGNVNLLQLVIMKKKRKFFYLTKCSYHLTDFQLDDILQECSPISKKNTDMVLDLDDGNITFSLKEKVGFDLFPDISAVDLNISDTWKIQVKYGKVVKTEVDIEMLMEELMKRNLNLDHDFIKQLREDKNKVLCLVTGVIHSTEESHIKMFKELDSEAKTSAKMLLTLSKNTEDKVENNQVLGHESNTALAYSIHELYVSFEDGSLKLMRPLELHGGVGKKSSEHLFFSIMFSTACQLLVQSSRGLSLIPVRSLHQSHKVMLYQLVVMEKKETLLSTKCSCHPTEYQLTEVLEDSSPISVEVEEEVLHSDWQKTTKFSLKEKFGFDLFPGTWTLDVRFGKVISTAVHINVLIEELMKRKLNLDHNFIKQVQKDKNKVLCLVTGVIHSTEESRIEIFMKLDSEAKTSAEMLPTLSKNTEVNVENPSHVLVLEGNNALAYDIRELDVSFEDGSLKLKVTKPLELLKEIHEELSEDLDIDFQYPKKVFQAILDLPEKDRNKLTSVLLNMMSVPRDIQIFIKLVEELADQVEELESQETQNINVQNLEKQLVTQKQSWVYLLELAGFTVQESGELSVPREVTPLLTCFGVLFDALSELQEKELDLIGKCAPQTVSALFATFEATLNETELTFSDVETISKDDKAIELLKQLGYSVSKLNILPPRDRHLTIDEVYVVMFALWGQKSK